MKNKKPIAFDLDGVLHSYTSGYTETGPEDPPVPGALEMVRGVLARGYKVVVMTSRADNPEAKARVEAWLAKWGFPELEVTNTKIHADLYVDDNGFRFEGDCDAVLKFIDGGMKKWNR
jgi:ribonucleotide monophosphatase NagD (HAD superfamily)